MAENEEAQYDEGVQYDEGAPELLPAEDVSDASPPAPLEPSEPPLRRFVHLGPPSPGVPAFAATRDKQRVRCLGGEKAVEADYVFEHDNEHGPMAAFEVIVAPLVRDAFRGADLNLIECGQRPRSFGPDGLGELAPMCCKELAAEARARMEQDPRLTVQVWMSYLEVYNNEVRDLMEQKEPGECHLRPLLVCGGRGQPVHLPNLTAHDVLSYASLDPLIVFGNQQRAWDIHDREYVARSHTILALRILQRLELGEELVQDTVSTIHCVDLAGFQRQPMMDARSKAEARHIGQSLQALCRALQGSAGAPMGWRDSKLTQILSSTLGPGARSVVVAHVAPDAAQRTEGYAALTYLESLRPPLVEASPRPAGGQLLIDKATDKTKKRGGKPAWSQWWMDKHMPKAPATPARQKEFRRQEVISHRQRAMQEAKERGMRRRKATRPEWDDLFWKPSTRVEKIADLSLGPAPPAVPPLMQRRLDEQRRREEEEKLAPDQLDAVLADRKKDGDTRWAYYFAKAGPGSPYRRCD